MKKSVYREYYEAILVAFILFMVGFTLWNPRFIDIDNPV